MMMVLPVLLAALAACVPVQGPVLTARGLAEADTRFASVPPDTALGYAPVPGSRRVIGEAEASRLATRFSLPGASRELCFEYAMHKLQPVEVREAMQTAIPGATIELLELSAFDVPEGGAVFPTASMPRPPAAHPNEPILWRGYVEYLPGRRFSIWAKVRLTVTAKRVVAMHDIQAGATLTADDLQARETRAFPFPGAWAKSVEELAGTRTLRSFTAGAPIETSWVQSTRQAIARGDSVTVEVWAGAAQIKLTARAETGAEPGGKVKLRNVKSGKVFEAEATGRGAARLMAGETMP